MPEYKNETSNNIIGKYRNEFGIDVAVTIEPNKSYISPYTISNYVALGLTKISDDPVFVATLAKIVEDVIFFNLYDNGESGSEKNIDFNNGSRQKLTLTDSCEITFIPPLNNKVGTVLLELVQGSGGNKLVTWVSNPIWANDTELVLSTVQTLTDIISIYFDGTDYFIQGANFYHLV